jgi:hypothetical protein
MLSDFRLNVDRLLASELVAIATPEECWAALMLWCRAWKQIPGGSLPNDERALAGFSGAGRRWKKVRDMAMRGFVLCADGRLYHRFLCDEVLRAYKSHLANMQRRDADKKRLSEWRTKRAGNGVETPDETRFVAEEPEPEPEPVRKEVPPPLSPPVPVGEFDRFWLYYPHKVGKRAAAAAFRRASARAPPAEIEAGLQRYLVEKPDDRPWCNPSTWLNQDRWLDQPDETPRSNGSGRNQQLSPSEALFLGAARAADAVERRDREAAARACCPDCPPAKPFLDRC